ncbi:hypothetical protein ROZALSC1DRAFT_28670 [Rozella allomycis CSF55]|uniref:P/Homo B domain-containing protein n=1 Tax=Rozella allomycis (strain CSF55) TaxID=988480 RepID=A0A075B1X3_ROZAC|nr:hypothetical protein O9G_005924 [Rozella allomycis CSF55]RKP19771.1 hypothetical protein ROZALSC1DRAFT_28670 [Rozella allomycis CSF55]|eukprot:EPZ36370.1 hypothetical protein O9G_005924 [Rozella allomycis CSF55]
MVPKRFNLEQVTIKRGDVEFYLSTPFKTVAQLSTRRQNDNSAEGLSDWTFATDAIVAGCAYP